jgi:hypothetical protein
MHPFSKGVDNMNNNSDLFTARGICKKLEMSPYKIKKENVELFFSSNTSVKRYNIKIKKYVEEIERKIERTTGISISCEIFAMLKLYKEIEKRGFYVKVYGFVYDNFNDIPFEICC